MVNTFLTSSPNDIDEKTGLKGYRISASNLDKSRLWKQVLESRQILDLVKSFHVLGQIFNMPCPKNPYLVKDWTKNIMKKYKELNYYVFLHQGEYSYYRKSKPKPEKIKYDEKYEIQKDGSILYKGKLYPKYSLVLPGDRFMSMGFWSHPVVIMWMNHADSLKLYINDHIDEFLSRGGKAATEKLKCKISVDVIDHPIWTMDTIFHLNHRCALITKEKVRNEKPWYIHKKEFRDAYKYYIDFPPDNKTKTTSSFEYYIWPFTQDIEEPRYNVVNDICMIKNHSSSKNLRL